MSETASANPTQATEDVSDNEYLLQLCVQPRFKRALGFFTGSLFAAAFQLSNQAISHS